MKFSLSAVCHKCRKYFSTEAKLTRICLILSAYTLFVFHIPFFRDVFNAIDGTFNGVFIAVSMFIIMLALNFLVYYLLLYCLRGAGKGIVSFTLVGNAICLYFINTYNVLIDRAMMGNVFNTQASEATSFFSWSFVAYILILGVPPCIWLFKKMTDYGSFKRFLANAGTALIVMAAILAGNLKNTTWIDYHAPVLGSKLMPWSYTVNSIRYYNYWKKMNQKEIRLPDATFTTDSKDIVVLIIGESARSQNFSLYGYERETNPLMASDSVVALKARASETYTTAAVKAILSHKPSGDLYEILPNYLQRNGVDVVWRKSNWGTPPLHIERNYGKGSLKDRFPEADDRYDGILFHGLKDEILSCEKDKIFIAIHTYTSHGPSYYANTPDGHKKFFPECTTVEMSKASQNELINSYDNTIVYTDYLVHSVIDMLRSDFPDRRSCVIFISDHGESLGEGGLYMHGVPKNMAPDAQLDIPFIVWTSDGAASIKDTGIVGHYHIYHSVLNFLGMDSPIYDESKNIFE